MSSGLGLVRDFFFFFLKFTGLRWETGERKGVDVDGAHAPVSIGNEGSLPSTAELHLKRSHPGAGQVFPPALAGFEREMQHLSPTPSHGDGIRSGGSHLPLPPCPWVWHNSILAGDGWMSERSGVPGSFPWCPLDCQRCWLYLPCPPAPAPGCRAGLPAGLWGRQGMDLGGLRSISGLLR